MGDTSIEWTDKTWSPIRERVKENAAEIARAKGYASLVAIAGKMAGHVGPHCERVSHGCDNCYSDTNNGRCLPANGTGLPFDRRSRDLVEPFVDERILAQPFGWKSPKRIFVENQSDLFGEWVATQFIDRVFAVASECARHAFQILTKRPDRMLAYVTADRPECWLPPNIWLGVSAEDQETADERIPLLLETPAAIRFVSYEPALGPVDFRSYLPKLDWIIIGGESGPGARPFDIAWARETIKQCRDAEVACFVKQLGARPYTAGAPVRLKKRKGNNTDEWPMDLCIREFPTTRCMAASSGVPDAAHR